MKCMSCEKKIKNPDHNTVNMNGKKYCKACAEKLTVKAKVVNIKTTPTEDVPKYPLRAVSKDYKIIMEENAIGKLDEKYTEVSMEYGAEFIADDKKEKEKEDSCDE